MSSGRRRVLTVLSVSLQRAIFLHFSFIYFYLFYFISGPLGFPDRVCFVTFPATTCFTPSPSFCILHFVLSNFNSLRGRVKIISAIRPGAFYLAARFRFYCDRCIRTLSPLSVIALVAEDRTM